MFINLLLETGFAGHRKDIAWKVPKSKFNIRHFYGLTPSRRKFNQAA